MIVTLLSALYFSLVFFPAISYQFGPQHNEGNIVENVIKPFRQWQRERDMRWVQQAYQLL